MFRVRVRVRRVVPALVVVSGVIAAVVTPFALAALAPVVAGAVFGVVRARMTAREALAATTRTASAPPGERPELEEVLARRVRTHVHGGARD